MDLKSVCVKFTTTGCGKLILMLIEGLLLNEQRKMVRKILKVFRSRVTD